MKYTTKVRILADKSRARPYEVVRYYADGTKRRVGFWKDKGAAEAEAAHIQAGIDARRIEE